MSATLPAGEPGNSIKEFFADQSLIRVLVGGRGAAKTTALADDICRHLWHSAGGRAILARKTETSQADSTIGTFRQFFATQPQIYGPATCGLFREWNNGLKFRVPSLKAIEALQAAREKLTSPRDILNWVEQVGASLCGMIEMRGLPNVTAGESKLRGMQCSYLAFIEGDQIDRRYFELALACLRWKGQDPATCDDRGYIKDKSFVIDTNPPGKKHWIALMEGDELEKPPSERQMRFWHIATDENAHNLPDGYIENQIMLPYRKNPAMIQRMRYGQYADAFDGVPVFYNYDQIENVGYDLPWVRGSYLVRGWDFGTFNSVVWFQYWVELGFEHLHAMAEQYLEGSDTDRQATSTVKFTDAEFPFWNDRGTCAGLLDFCDPAGMNSNFGLSRNANGEKVGSCVEILNTHGIRPGTLLWQKRVAIGTTIINRFLEQRDHRGQALMKIDAKNCPNLHAAFSGGYRFPAPGEPGYGNDDPLKGQHGGMMDYSHLADPTRYVFLNIMKLEKNKYEESKKPLFREREIEHRKPINAARRL